MQISGKDSEVEEVKFKRQVGAASASKQDMQIDIIPSSYSYPLFPPLLESFVVFPLAAKSKAKTTSIFFLCVIRVRLIFASLGM